MEEKRQISQNEEFDISPCWKRLGLHTALRGFPALLQSESRMPHWFQILNFCAESPVGAGVTNGFYLLPKNTAPISPAFPSCLTWPPRALEQKAALRHHLFLPAPTLGPAFTSVKWRQLIWWVVLKKYLVSPPCSLTIADLLKTGSVMQFSRS